MSLQKPECVWSTVAEHNADVVAWCPVQDDLFVCGTYELLENSVNERIGGLEVFRVEGKNCSKIQQVESPGVLDLRWLLDSTGERNHLLAALADGHLGILPFSSDNRLQEMRKLTSAHESSIVMSLDTSNLEHGLVSSCDSAGYLTIQNVFGDKTGIRQWKAHDFEIWTVAFDKHERDILYSGSDDCRLRCWDLREDLCRPSQQVNVHSMGVTSLAPCQQTPHTLISGSYDEEVFLWDTRKLKLPMQRSKVGGGIWRLRWHPSEDWLLVACMHAGFLVLDKTLSIKAEYKKHDSLAYGVDWSSKVPSKSGDPQFVASCSFYDKAIHLWSLTLS